MTPTTLEELTQNLNRLASDIAFVKEQIRQEMNRNAVESLGQLDAFTDSAVPEEDKPLA